MSRVRRLFQRLGHKQWFLAFSRVVGARFDRLVHFVTRGRLTYTGIVLPVLLITTTGRRSGRPRTTPVLYVRDGDAFILSAESYEGGTPSAWALNLEADPNAVVQLRGRSIRCRGRRLADEEAERHWPSLLEVWPAYETYRERTGTRYVFRLDPVA